MLSQLKYKRIQPLQAHVDASFAGSLEFAWTVASNERMVWDDSYLAVKLKARYSDGGAYAAFPTGATAVGFANSPMSCLFTDASLRINNREVSRLSEYPTGSMVHQLLTQSAQKQDNNSSSNPISLERRWATDAGVDDAGAILRVRDSLGLDRASTLLQTFTVSGRPPVFLTKSEVDGNISCILRLVVDPQFRDRITLTAGGQAISTATSAAAAGATPTVHLDVDGMILNIRTYETDSVPRSVVSKYESSEVFSTTRALIDSAGTQRYTFTTPRSVSSFFFCFLDSRTGGPYSPTRFISQAAKSLTGYELRYSGTTVPSPKHILSLGDASADRSENNDAFKNFIYDSMDLSPNGSQYSAIEWASQPLFYHAVVKPAGSEASECTLDLTFAAQPSNSILYFGAFSPRLTEVVYNDIGIVSDVRTSDLVA